MDRHKASVLVKEAIGLIDRINTDFCCGRVYKMKAKAFLKDALKELEEE